MGSRPGIKFIVSDLDGVIRHFPGERSRNIEREFGLPMDALLSAAFEKNILSRAICGLITDLEWRQKTAELLSRFIPLDKAELAVKKWSEFPGTVDARYLKFVESRFPGIPVSILTNATSRLPFDLETLGLHKQFFKIFNSANIGICKPDIKIFRHVVEHLGCQPSEVLFIDDSNDHVSAAQSLGMRIHHYKSLELFQVANF